MKKLFLLVIFSTITLLGCQNKKPEIEKQQEFNEPAAEISANKAPDFSLINTNGEEIELSDYKGKIVILDFWATWCGPCRMGVPDLVELQKEYNDDVIIIGISTDKFSRNR